jgi:hypothetical protein
MRSGGLVHAVVRVLHANVQLCCGDMHRSCDWPVSLGCSSRSLVVPVTSGHSHAP